MNQEDLKNRLQELIETSESMNELPEDERVDLVKEMLEGDPEQLKEIIKALEEEQKDLEKVDEEVNELKEVVDDAVSEAKILEQEAARDKLKEDETIDQNNVSEVIDTLTQKLETIAKDDAPKIIEKKKISFTPTTALRETMASLIGSFMCGLAGILIIYLTILPMGTYERLDIAFSLKPPLFFPAYWVAVIFSAILGLIVVPFLRLIKTKSLILSILLGGIMGGIIVGIAHMATGLTYDIIIMQNINPIGFRGYWIAVIFSILIGFFAQLINRVINKISFFKIAE
ncbi:hypothetical protein ACFL3T_03220 [Patescibacteria group bacterium]